MISSRGFFLLFVAMIAVSCGQQQNEIDREMEKRKSAYMRFGRSDPSLEMEKRKSAYMRFGKRSSTIDEAMDGGEDLEMEKRKSAYMRFGKRSAVPLSMDEDLMSAEKRKSAYMSDVEMIEDPSGFDGEHELSKRKSAYMRFGKRSELDLDHDMMKRKSAYMRFGK